MSRETVTPCASAISGSTRFLAVIGDPIAQLKAPEAIGALASERGWDLVCLGWHVTRDGLSDVIAAALSIKNLIGLVITVPHKPAALACCASLSARAARIGAVNVLRREEDGWYGDNLDGVGFVSGLERAHGPVRGRRVLMIGAGGAGAAIAVGLADAGIAELAIHELHEVRKKELISRLRVAYPDLAVPNEIISPRKFEIVVNATPLGMAPGDPLPMAMDQLGPDTLVADVIMQPRVTPFLRQAAALGHRIHAGRAMLESQLDSWSAFFSLDEPDA